jgi:glycine/D-amino acid oxidase-like deaminating enzyme
VKTWDAIVVGGGIIGLSLSIALRKRGLKVLVVEKRQPGREASHAAAGMIADGGDEFPPAMHALAKASAKMYPEFVHELQDESGTKIDLRDEGTVLLHHSGRKFPDALPAQLAELEPGVINPGLDVCYLKERSVDPRGLVAAALKAAKHREVDISSGTAVTEMSFVGKRINGVQTERTFYGAPIVVNCAGAWAGTIGPHKLPTRPVKGQIIAVVGAPVLRHVLRTPGIYLVPRSDGRIVIGATIEDVGFDKRTDPDTVQQLHRSAVELVPELAKAKTIEAWAGLRPGTPDNLPILGSTTTQGYFVATGHFRDGIMLAPVTAALMAELIVDGESRYDLSAFSSERFADQQTRELEFRKAI